jgi:hypothetical protein
VYTCIYVINKYRFICAPLVGAPREAQSRFSLIVDFSVALVPVSHRRLISRSFMVPSRYAPHQSKPRWCSRAARGLSDDERLSWNDRPFDSSHSSHYLGISSTSSCRLVVMVAQAQRYSPSGAHLSHLASRLVVIVMMMMGLAEYACFEDDLSKHRPSLSDA